MVCEALQKTTLGVLKAREDGCPKIACHQGPVYIIGGGRIGTAFLQIAGARGKILKRGENVPDSSPTCPILVATHCSHLDAVLAQTGVERWKDLVFTQNGMLQPWLRRHGLQDNTQMLLYMSAFPEATGKSMKIVTGGRESLVWGRWACTVAEMMHSKGLPASEVTHRVFLDGVIEKLLWSSIFWLLSAALGGVPVGRLAKEHTHDVLQLTTELLPLAHAGSFSDGIVETFPDTQEVFYKNVKEMVDRLCAYSLAIADAVPSVDVARSEFSWRNGWFLELKHTPLHVMWLKKAGFEPSST